MRRKAPVAFGLVATEGAKHRSKHKLKHLPSSPIFHSNSRIVLRITDNNMPRTISTSPASRSSIKKERFFALGEIQNQIHTRKPKSILKRKSKLAHYKHCVDLVERRRDGSIASNYEMLLYSNMVMEKDRAPCFRCRLCPRCPRSTFYCQSLEDFQATAPMMEKHLLECPNAPHWLNQELHRTKRTHFAEIDPRKPYSHLVWKRILAHCIFSHEGPKRRVQFSPRISEEFIIHKDNRDWQQHGWYQQGNNLYHHSGWYSTI